MFKKFYFFFFFWCSVGYFSILKALRSSPALLYLKLPLLFPSESSIWFPDGNHCPSHCPHESAPLTLLWTRGCMQRGWLCTPCLFHCYGFSPSYQQYVTVYATPASQKTLPPSRTVSTSGSSSGGYQLFLTIGDSKHPRWMGPRCPSAFKCYTGFVTLARLFSGITSSPQNTLEITDIFRKRTTYLFHSSNVIKLYHFCLFKDFICLFLERGKGREKE